MKLKAIIQKKIDALVISGRSLENYEVNHWSHMTADNNGSVRALTQVITLLDFVKDLK